MLSRHSHFLRPGLTRIFGHSQRGNHSNGSKSRRARQQSKAEEKSLEEEQWHQSEARLRSLQITGDSETTSCAFAIDLTDSAACRKSSAQMVSADELGGDWCSVCVAVLQSCDTSSHHGYPSKDNTAVVITRRSTGSQIQLTVASKIPTADSHRRALTASHGQQGAARKPLTQLPPFQELSC